MMKEKEMKIVREEGGIERGKKICGETVKS